MHWWLLWLPLALAGKSNVLVPCGGNPNLSWADQQRDCAEKNGERAKRENWYLVAKGANAREEYWEDRESGLIWGPMLTFTEPGKKAPEELWEFPTLPFRRCQPESSTVPTVEDFILADQHHADKVLPDWKREAYWARSYRSDAPYAWRVDTREHPIKAKAVPPIQPRGQGWLASSHLRCVRAR